MTLFRAITLTAVLGFGATFGGLSPSMAQSFPDRPITLVVPFAAGGSTDLVARVVATKLSSDFGKQVVVENVGGAGGSLGAERVAKAKPDGYTILMGTVATHALNPLILKKKPYDAEKDFAPVSLLVIVPNVLVVNPQLPVKTVAELIELLKKNPDKYSYASSGNGTPLHLSGELFKSMAGVFMTHIPYSGSGPAMMGMLSGNVDVMFDNLPSAMPQIRSGKLKAFAVTSAQRSSAMPDLPTVEEAAGLKGFDASSWFGLLAPAGTPAEVVNRLQQETAKALGTPAIKEKLLAQGAIPSGNTPAEFARVIDAEIRKWAPVVRASGAKVD